MRTLTKKWIFAFLIFQSSVSVFASEECSPHREQVGVFSFIVLQQGRAPWQSESILSITQAPQQEASSSSATNSTHEIEAILDHESQQDEGRVIDQEELALLGGLFHSIRNSAGILVNILEFSPAEWEDEGNHTDSFREIFNQTDPQIVNLLEGEIMPSIASLEQELHERTLKKSKLLELGRKITNWIELVRTTDLPWFHVLKETLVDLERLVGDFETYQLRGVTFPLIRTATHLRQLLGQFEQTKFPHHHPEVMFKLEIDEDVPNEFMITDGGRIKQILLNLLYNAFKFTRLGSVTLHVGFDSNRNHLTFEIRDTGIGIPPHELTRVFNPFVQGEQSSTCRSGLGLGLRVVKILVTAFGGDLKIKSQVGKGSTFSFTIPVNPAERSVGEKEREKEEEG